MATVYTLALTGNNTGDFNGTHRELITPLVTGSLGQVRVTFQSGTSTAGLNVAHCSIGVASGTSGNCTATPVELTFAAAHGFIIAVNSQIVSDWVNLSFLSSDSLVVVVDLGTDNNNDNMRANTTTAAGSDIFHASSQSYNLQNAPSGSTVTTGQLFCATLVETQSGVAAATPTPPFPTTKLPLVIFFDMRSVPKRRWRKNGRLWLRG